MSSASRLGWLLGLGLVGLVSASACWPDRLVGKACDYEHPCFDGYRCVESVCIVDDGTLKLDDVDAGTAEEPGTDAGETDAGDADAGDADAGDAG